MKLFLNLKRISFRNLVILAHLMLWVSMLLLSGQMDVFAGQESGSPAIYQGRTIQGTVTDDSGVSIPGVNVVIKGTTIGVVTNVNGSYSITVPNDAVLVFSFVGYVTQEVPVGIQTQINVTLSEDSQQIEEVVVVGYGTIRKADLTGSVSVIDPVKAIGSRPVSDLARGLQGISPGLTIISNTGDIGVAPKLYIRSIVGSINSEANPLILLDGMEIPNLQAINPKDIESISVLKDASSTAVYGTRGSFGVVLLTSKKGTKGGGFRVNYDNNFSWSKPINLPELAPDEEFIDYMLTARRMRLNAAQVNFSNLGAFYDEISIKRIRQWKDTYGGMKLADELIEGRDYEFRDNMFFPYRPFDIEEVFLRNAAPTQQHNFSVSGSTDRMNFTASLNYLDQQGIIKVTPEPDRYKRFTTYLRVDGQVNKWFKPFFLARISNENKVSPQFRLQTGNAPTEFWFQMYRYPQTYPYSYVNGVPLRNIRTELEQANMNSDGTFTGQTQLGTAFTPLEGLNIEAKYGIWFSNRDIHSAQAPIGAIDFAQATTDLKNYNPDIFPNDNWIRRSSNKNIRHSGNAVATYQFKLHEDHRFTVIGGMEFDWTELESHFLQITNMMFPQQPEFSLAGGVQTGGGGHSHSASMRYFGRLIYNYSNRYTLQFSGGAEGASNFPPGKKWGFFPSVSAGWTVSNEKFWTGATLNDILPYLKMRFSYGSVGNNRFGHLYLATMSSVNSNWWIGGTNQRAYNSPTLVSKDLTWETVRTYDLGFDARLFKNSLDVEFGVFRRITDDMIVPGEKVPSSLGTSAPRINFGTMLNDGWELALTYNKAFNNGLSFSVRGTIADGMGKITKYSENYAIITGGGTPGFNPNGISTPRYYEGQTIGEIWGLETDRLFTYNDFSGNDGAANNKAWDYASGVPNQNSVIAPGVVNFKFGPGDIKYKDTNGDGEVNFGDPKKDNVGTTDNPGDLRVIGNETPRYCYGLTLSGAFKGFDLSIFFQGVGKREMWCVGPNVIPNWTGANEAMFSNQMDFWKPNKNYSHTEREYWISDNPNAYYPAPSQPTVSVNSGNWVCQTRYLHNMAYLRLKNLEIGYTLPDRWMSKVKIEKLRVFFSGENLYTWDKLKGVMLDPEIQKNADLSITDPRAFGRTYPYFRALSCGVSLTF